MRAQRYFCVAFLQMFPVSWQLARSTSSPALEKADVSWFFRQLLVEPKKQNQSELQLNKKAARAISSERFVSCFSILKDSTFFQRRNLDRETDALTRDAWRRWRNDLSQTSVFPRTCFSEKKLLSIITQIVLLRQPVLFPPYLIQIVLRHCFGKIIAVQGSPNDLIQSPQCSTALLLFD